MCKPDKDEYIKALEERNAVQIKRIDILVAMNNWLKKRINELETRERERLLENPPSTENTS
jgi:hypothetical protein